MRAEEFVTERKKKKRKIRRAAYGPGPFGGYGFATGYSGDGGAGGDGGGIGESVSVDSAVDSSLTTIPNRKISS